MPANAAEIRPVRPCRSRPCRFPRALRRDARARLQRPDRPRTARRFPQPLPPTGGAARARRLEPRRQAGHGRRLDEPAPALLRARARPGDPVRRRRRPAGLRLVRHQDRDDEAGMAGMAPAGPGGRPPPQSLRRRPDLPRHMPGGIETPLGARAIYLGSSLYRIHGSNEPETIGAAVSSGCIRMTNRDVTDLYERVRVGTKVVVLRWARGALLTA